MDKKTLAVVAAAMLGLAACGSGSKGGSGKIVTSPEGGGGKPSAPSTPSTPTINESDKAEETAEKEFYGVIGISKLHPDVNEDEGSYKVTEDLNILNVNGRSIELIPESAQKETTYRNRIPAVKTTNAPYLGSGNSPYREHYSWSWVGNELPNVKYGELHDQGERHYIFAQGNATPVKELPTERKVINYKGRGTHTFTEKDIIQNDKGEESTVISKAAFLEADVDVKVNFAEKTLIGEITPINVPDEIKPETIMNNPDRKPWMGGVKPTVIKATITDNKFTGFEYGSKTEVKGGFFGPNASELGGAYTRKSPEEKEKWTEDNYDTQGVFGAKQQ